MFDASGVAGATSRTSSFSAIDRPRHGTFQNKMIVSPVWGIRTLDQHMKINKLSGGWTARANPRLDYTDCPIEERTSEGEERSNIYHRGGSEHTRHPIIPKVPCIELVALYFQHSSSHGHRMLSPSSEQTCYTLKCVGPIVLRTVGGTKQRSQ